MKSEATKTRRRRCSECGELKHEVLGRQKLCEECEHDREYCTICDAWEHSDSCCRHVQWSDEFGCCCGCGTNHIEAESHLASFEALLEKLEPLRCGWTYSANMPLLPEMSRLIAANNFWTFWHGPLIGAPPNVAFKYEERVRGKLQVFELIDIRGSDQEDWGEEAIEEMQLGMAWLTSLDDRSTKANALTAQWIDEYLARKAASNG